MLNHTRIYTVLASVILIAQFLFINNYVTGFRKPDGMMYNAFSRKTGGDESRKARELYMTTETNDVMHTERDVINKQEVSSSSSTCPTDCKCYYREISQLVLSCENRFRNATSLLPEINAYLLSVAWNFTQLTVQSTPLTTVPEAICQLERLTSLFLVRHRLLTKLPDNCFTRLHELQLFGTQDCGLTSLQNGLFDNLTKLRNVYLAYNQISLIGGHLFDVTANLPNLQAIRLQYNNLTEIDVWPVQRAQMNSGSIIDLQHNHISRFTNSLGWHYDCNSAPLLSPQINLMYNNITHLNDLLHSWNITGLFCCIVKSVILCRRLKAITLSDNHTPLGREREFEMVDVGVMVSLRPPNQMLPNFMLQFCNLLSLTSCSPCNSADPSVLWARDALERMPLPISD